MSIPTAEQAPPRCRITSLEVLCLVLLAAVLAQGPVTALLDAPALRTGATVFVAVCVQAMPFLVFGVLLSGAIAAFVPVRAFHRLLPLAPLLWSQSPGWLAWRCPGVSARRCRCPGG